MKDLSILSLKFYLLKFFLLEFFFRKARYNIYSFIVLKTLIIVKSPPL